MSAAAVSRARAALASNNAPFPRERLADLARSRPAPDRGARYWVYGAGAFGRALAAELSRVGLHVRGLVDRRAREMNEAGGFRCVHPEDFGEGEFERSRLVHGVMNHATSPREITIWADESGFEGLHFPADFYAIPGFAVSSYWLADPEDLLAALPRFEELHGALEDDESRRVLVSLLEYRLTTDPRVHPALATGEPYLPDFFAALNEAVTFVDGGAFNGDTLEALMRSCVRLKEWLGFEPDPQNFQELVRTVERFRNRLPACTLFQAGLAEKGGTLSFSGAAGAASKVVSGTGRDESFIQVVSLDESVSRPGPLYVKLDIEGAEAAALRGMARTLRNRPLLAVSVYHQPSDLWQLPLLVRSLYPEPMLRLRQHGHHGFDTVLYVSPR